MSTRIGRRRFLKTGMLLSTAPLACNTLEERKLLGAMKRGVDVEEERRKDASDAELPTGQLGDLKLSRLLAGGNSIQGWLHQRDLLYVSRLAQAYLAGTKKFDTLQLMEEKGINGIVIGRQQLVSIQEYRRERGGRMQTIVAMRQEWEDWDNPTWDDLKTHIDRTIDMGPDALFTHGGYSDRLVETDPANVELLGKAVQYAREQGFPAGLGSHDIHVPMEFDKLGIEPDFYVKTFHHDQYWSATPHDRRKKWCVDAELYLDHNEFHDNIYDIFPEKTSAYMKNKKQPWIAFKVLAAGAIHPKSGFQYAFENGTDFISVGMFDFNVIENTIVAKTVLKATQNRERPWRA